MLQKNNIVELAVSGISFDGLGVARYSDTDVSDFVVFIKNALPGDLVDCHITKVTKHQAYGFVDRILQPSSDRIPTACDSFPKCGGCSFLNTKYETELNYKLEIVKNAFRMNYGKSIPEIKNVVPSPILYGYRNKVQYPVSSLGKFCFYAKRSHRTESIDGCVLQPAIFEKITALVEEYISRFQLSCYDEETGKGLIRHLYLRMAPATGEIMVCLVINGKDLPHKEQFTSLLTTIPDIKSIWYNINTLPTNVVLGQECVLLWGEEYITDILCGLKFRISPLAFYQINSKQAENIYRFVAENADLKKDDVLLDLFCGIGTIGLSVATKVKKMIGVEIIHQAVDAAYQNAQINNIRNAEFFCSDAKNLNMIFSEKKEEQFPSIIIVDPPRKGLEKQTIDTINDLKPRKLIYISCNPTTQARDLDLLNKENTWEIESINPFDMFPRTNHVENVVFLNKKE